MVLIIPLQIIQLEFFLRQYAFIVNALLAHHLKFIRRVHLIRLINIKIIKIIPRVIPSYIKYLHFPYQKQMTSTLDEINNTNILMLKLQKQTNQIQWNRLKIKSIDIKVKFTCRCFLEYQIYSDVYRTKQIKIDSKNTHYEINQYVQIQKTGDNSIKKRKQQLKITVKLLSSKGLSFTIGSIEINQQMISRYGNKIDLKIMQTQDIQARCMFQYEKIVEVEFNTPKRQINQFNILIGQNVHQITSSEKSKNSKFQLEFQELRDDYFKLKDKFLKYEDSNGEKVIHRAKWSQQVKSNQHDELKQRNRILEDRIQLLQKELIRNNELFNKQKQILLIFESNLKERNSQCEELRRTNKELNIKYEDIYKQNCILQEEKIKILMDQFKNQKEKCLLGQYMAQMFEQVYHVIQNIFKRKITNISELAQSKQLKKKSSNINLTNNQPPIKKLFYSTDFKRCKQVIAQDVSIDLSASDINSITHDLQMKHILKEYQPQFTSGFGQQCIENVKNYCCKIQKIVHQSVQKLFKKIIELTSYNQQYKKQITRQKQQFENNEQSLIDYLQQLENGLQRQLAITKQKDIELEHKDQIIQSLNQLIRDKDNRIKELEEAYEKLEDLKNQIKTQLHQNNYIYATKEEEYLKKIYQLQTGFQKPHYDEPQHPQKISHIYHRKQMLVSQHFNDQQFFQNQVIYQSPHLENRLNSCNLMNPVQNGLIEDEQANLRYTMLKDRRNSLIKKLREQMDVKSVDEEQESNNKEEKVIEEQFLKVLV